MKEKCAWRDPEGWRRHVQRLVAYIYKYQCAGYYAYGGAQHIRGKRHFRKAKGIINKVIGHRRYQAQYYQQQEAFPPSGLFQPGLPYRRQFPLYQRPYLFPAYAARQEEHQRTVYYRAYESIYAAPQQSEQQPACEGKHSHRKEKCGQHSKQQHVYHRSQVAISQ